MNYLLEHGPATLAKGYTVIPIVEGQKHPGIAGWRDPGAVDTTTLTRWANEGNNGVGIVCGSGVVALDVDVLADDLVGEVAAYVRANITKHPVVRIGKAPKALLVFRTSDNFRKLMSKKYSGKDGSEHRIEVLSEGQQFVAYGRHPDTGQDYVWPEGSLPAQVDLPPISERQLRELILWFEDIMSTWGFDSVLDGNVESAEPRPYEQDATDLFERLKPPVDRIDAEEIRDQLATIAKHRSGAGSYSYWFRVGQALWHQFEGSEVGLDLWDEFSKEFPSYDYGELEWKWSAQLDWRKFSNPVTYASILRDYKALAGSIDVAAVADAELGIEAEPENQVSTTSSETSNTEPDAEPATPQDKARAYLEKHGLTPQQLRAALAPVDWVVRDLVPSDTVGFLYGPPSSYKSFVAFDVALCVASGEAWHGNELCRPGGVMVIAGEGQGGLGRRWAAWEQASGADLSGLPLVASRGAFYLDTPEGLQGATTLGRALEVAHGVDLELLVIDTLARNTAGDENKAQDVAAIVKAADTLRETFGCAVMLVHHSGKNLDNGMRGSSGLLGAADWVYLVNKVAEDCCSVECQKTKDAKEPDERFFRSREIVIEDTGHDEQIESLVLDSISRADVPDPDAELGLPTGKQLVALRAVQTMAGDSEAEFGGLSTQGLVQALIDAESFTDDLTGKRSARNAIRSLVEKGHLRQEGDFTYIENWS